ncbi:NRDE domain protein [Natronomonas pharaonis DSM 2160]|uniref:NRDE domain protein n=1 Tax=Natronomonas pharaonis (strain ATCC 35678 / DSM 2160 / CIP 103997 / JCM 8858 / NBRC 14720 / NCIMB 2260 / Gabara) TaxID=348780 RepID=A0A1U7EWK5_NATPD|nr:NRDE family protein [Natronomonas pharaonis]CAI49473.1 NRDE domain protein [Natronomonas pharaonis DSM 2160]
MCTLVAAWHAFDNAPLCVAANRDEAANRPSTPPFVRDRDPTVVAPRDDRAGGTWLGYNAAGVLVAVTNRWRAGDGDRSRGLLVDEALGYRSAAAAVDHVRAELEARRYAPFHLLVADAENCLLVVHDSGDTGVVHQLSPGVHAVVNVGFDGDWFTPTERPELGRQQARNTERLRSALEPKPDESAADWTSRAGTLLGDHEYGACIHRGQFGTRSSSLVRLGEQRRFEFADGPPCDAEYRPVEDAV